MNVNQEGFHRRLDALQKILQQYNLKSTQVTPIAYVEHCPFHFNNFIYKVDLESPAIPATFPNQQPCTSTPPAEGISTLVIRMSNPLAEGLNNANRVENDVAAQYLARQSIQSSGLPSVVPAVYAWAPCRYPDVPGEAGFGWTMTEFKTGSDLDAEFPSLALDDAIDAIQQLASIFAATQGAEFPETVTKFGALTLDDQGVIRSGQPPLLKTGPFDTYAELWVAKLQTQLSESDKSPLFKGWAEGGVRDRIDKFIASGGVGRVLKDVDTSKRVLVHGDLSELHPLLLNSTPLPSTDTRTALNNVLYDNTAKRITAVLDFDWSAVTHPCDEFLTGLWDIGGGIHERNEKFLPMLLSGDFSTQPDGLSADDIRKWEVAKAWNEAITRAGAIRPSNIAGVDRIQALKGFEDSLCPFELANEVMLKRTSDEKKLSRRKEMEAKILKFLETYGNTE
ncbi:hypothetical protein K449DRAFT_419927 [Hypoxylon sp. EC38]|nr:hypothetical protein K449DRAFT_419927 [Hypoxylon sp. EC38]